MKRKSSKATDFIANLHDYVVSDSHFRKTTHNKTESEIQCELRPIITSYLQEYYQGVGVRSSKSKAIESIYWEGQEGGYKGSRKCLFGSMNYPEFIILEPYLIAVEYKKSTSGSLVKSGVGQSNMHIFSGEYDYVYFLFQDESKGKKIRESMQLEEENKIRKTMWDKFNVYMRIV